MEFRASFFGLVHHRNGSFNICSSVFVQTVNQLGWFVVRSQQWCDEASSKFASERSASSSTQSFTIECQPNCFTDFDTVNGLDIEHGVRNETIKSVSTTILQRIITKNGLKILGQDASVHDGVLIVTSISQHTLVDHCFVDTELPNDLVQQRLTNRIRVGIPVLVTNKNHLNTLFV